MIKSSKIKKDEINMYYFLLLLAVLLFAGQFAFTKIYGDRVQQKNVQTLIMLIITNITACVIFLIAGGFRINFTPDLIFLSAAFAAVMIPYYILGIKVLSVGSVAIYSMFMMLGGMFLPFVYGLGFLSESITPGKALGCVILTVSICMQAIVQKKTNDTTSASTSQKNLFTMLCIAIFILNGLTGVIAKAYEISEAVPDEKGFTVVSCFLTALFSGILLIPQLIKDKKVLAEEIKVAFHPSVLGWTVLIGVSGYTGNFCHLKAAAELPASVQFPMVSGGVIVFSALASVLIFREKISKKEWLCVIGACLSTIMFVF